MAKRRKKKAKVEMKAKPVKKAPVQDDFYVSITNPSQVQVPLLEGRKLILESMRVFTQLRDLRRKKAEERHELREQIALITKSINKIKNSIPTVQVDEAPSLPARKESSAQVKVPEQAPEPEPLPMHSVDKIEEGLKDIESKLAMLQR